MWQYALWGLGGAAANRALIFTEASTRVNDWPWKRPHGPGGGVFFVSQVLHLGIGALVAAAAPETGFPSKPLLLVGLGAAAPVVLKKLTQWAQATVIAIANAEVKTSGKNVITSASDEQAAESR